MQPKEKKYSSGFHEKNFFLFRKAVLCLLHSSDQNNFFTRNERIHSERLCDFIFIECKRKRRFCNVSLFLHFFFIFRCKCDG